MPIHMAVKSGNVDIVKLLLLEYQVQLTSTNISSETPLHIACQYNRTDVLQVLINYQNEIIDLEVRDYQGYTPLLTASYFNHQDCIRILLINRANITAIDNNGKNICKYYLTSISNENIFSKYTFVLNNIVKMLYKNVFNGSKKILVAIACLFKVIDMRILYFMQVSIIS
jgi:ankyrin repeat protein